ncbi:MAG: glycine cleavage system aminomethyltransferase GcvT [Solirubrobacteraceae bacterium]
MAGATSDLKRTPLYAEHVAAGAKLVPFAGWEMPIQYTGIREEHLAVRRDVGIFDVSHMGQVVISGPQAQERLQRLVTSDVRRMPEGGAQYSLLCDERGHVLDDLFLYRLGESRFLVVTNAGNHPRDTAWMQSHGEEFDAEVCNCQADFAMLAVQGPKARALVQQLADGKLPPRLHCCERTVAGVPLLVCGTGYTGEDGVELLCDPDQAAPLWAALVQDGARPVGLGARDTLRMEACFHLYGNDLDQEHDPISAGLGWACAEQTGFIGADAISKVRVSGPELKLVPFVIEGPGIARQGNPVLGGGAVTSGTFSPSLERGIGLAYVSAERAMPGTPLQIDVRGTMRAAVVMTKPLYGKDQ